MPHIEIVQVKLKYNNYAITLMGAHAVLWEMFCNLFNNYHLICMGGLYLFVLKGKHIFEI